jgi:hypothetical protein
MASESASSVGIVAIMAIFLITIALVVFAVFSFRGCAVDVPDKVNVDVVPIPAGAPD